MGSEAGPGQRDPAPLSCSDEQPSVALSAGRPACQARRKSGAGELAPAFRRAAASTSGCSLQLPGLARLRVVALAAQVCKNARLLHLLLEALERPVEAIIIAELNLDQSAVLLVEVSVQCR